MKKSFKIILAVLMIMTFVASFAILATAQDVVTTHTAMYIGEYENRDAHIVFGTVSNPSAGYGVIIKDVESGVSYAFEGKYIGADGKFGIAIYAMEEGGEYTAKVYSGDPENGIYGEEIPFTSGKSEYTVKFYDEDDQLVKTETVAHGGSATAPEVEPFKVSSWFNGYDADYSVVHTDIEARPVFETSTGVEGLKVYKGV